MEKTIPIEIVLQDPNDPIVPTPDTPSDTGTGTTETSIAVPNTGNGIDTGADNNMFSSSAATTATIASIAVLVLTIVAAIVLAVRRYHKRKTSESGITRQERRATIATSTIAVLALTVLLGQLLTTAVVQPNSTNAVTSDGLSNDEAELDVDSKITIVVERTEDSDVVVATVKNTSIATSYQTFGYRITASMEEEAETANLYLNGDETSEYYITPISNEESEGIETNTWGYRLSEESEDYLPIPLANNPAIITKGNNNIEDEPVDVYYTIKVDKDLPTGTYTAELEYTLTDNNFPSTLTTMQGMTTEICEDTFTPGNQVTDPVPTATLTDIRDDKTYTIAKLADGNCWMTQNLDLDLDKNKTFTPADTNINEDWTPERKTIAPDELSTETWQYDQIHPYSYNPGDVYYYTSNSDADDIQYSSLVECEVAGHTDCSHYHAGNYYNWTAAIASNDSSAYTEQYTNADTSICPAGWSLPYGPNAEGTYYGDMYNMIDSYVIIDEEQYNAIRAKPFWLVRSGRVYYGGSVNSATSEGYYWSNTVKYPSGYAYGLIFGTRDVRWDIGENKMAGCTIRCIAE